MKNQKTSNLLQFAKGEKPQPPSMMVLIELKDNKIQVRAQLIEHADSDMINTMAKTRSDAEFFKSFDSAELVEKVRKVLIQDKETGKQRITPVFPNDIL